MEESVVVAVYGTLRRGERNRALLAGARFLGVGVVYLYRGRPEELGERIASGDWVAHREHPLA